MVSESTNFLSGNTIDLCLVSDEDRIGSCEVLPPFPSCSHGIVKVYYTFQFESEDRDSLAVQEYRNKVWTRANFAGMKSCLEQLDLDSRLHSLPVKDQYDIFLDVYRALEERFVPKQEAVNKKNVPWCLNPPRSLIRAKTRAWSEYKETRGINGRSHPYTVQAWNDFNRSNVDIKRFAVNSQMGYEKKVASQINTKPKLFHSYIRHRKVGKPSVGPLKLN